MKIDVFTIAWNEEKNIQQFIDYYGKFANSITIYDNNSNDKTVEIALSNNCKVINYGSNEQDNEEMRRVKEECWKESTADWVIVCDVDEYIFHPDLLGFLEKTPASIIKCIGYQMISEKHQIFEDVKVGARDDMYDKCICFKPSKISKINWGVGCHICYPCGDVCMIQNEVKLLHYKLIGRDEVKQRYKNYHARMSQNDLVKGFGIQYTYTEEKIDREFDEILNKAINIL